jgi:hypothetical protein
MNEMKIELTARAGCWNYTVRLDGELIARSRNSFTDPRKAMNSALEEIARSRKTMSGRGLRT